MEIQLHVILDDTFGAFWTGGSNNMLWMLLALLPALCLNILVFNCGRKKDDNKKFQPLDKSKGNNKSPEQPTSKRCNSHGGLLADDPDLKSFQHRPGCVAATPVTTNTTSPKKDNSPQEATDLRSFEEDGGPKKKENKDAATKPQLPDAMSAYAKPGQSEMLGVSMLAMNANLIDKDKLPVKLRPKEQEVIAQDSTQEDTQSRDKKFNESKKKTETSKKAGKKANDTKEANLKDNTKDVKDPAAPHPLPVPAPAAGDKKDTGLVEGGTQSVDEGTQMTKAMDTQMAMSALQPTKRNDSARNKSKKDAKLKDNKATQSKLPKK